MLVTRRATVDSTKIICSATNHIQIKLPVPFNIRRIQTFLLLKNWLCNCPSAVSWGMIPYSPDVPKCLSHHPKVDSDGEIFGDMLANVYRLPETTAALLPCHLCSSNPGWSTKKTCNYMEDAPPPVIKKNFHICTCLLFACVQADWCFFVLIFFLKKEMISEDTIYSLFWSQHKSARFLQHRSMDHRILVVICCGPRSAFSESWANPMISICPPIRWGLRTMQLSRMLWRDSLWMKHQVSQKRHEFYWNLIVIRWVVPPPSNCGKWRFIGIPYYKCNNPGGDCCWEGGQPKWYVSYQIQFHKMVSF